MKTKVKYYRVQYINYNGYTVTKLWTPEVLQLMSKIVNVTILNELYK